jgi:phage terminase small subunit
MSLSAKQLNACRAYISGKSMRQALLEAGYSESTAAHNSFHFFKNREVIKFIRDRQLEVEKAIFIDQAYVSNALYKIANMNGVAEKDKNAALKIIQDHLDHQAEIKMRLQEVEAKVASLKQQEKLSSSPITINLNEIKKPE